MCVCVCVCVCVTRKVEYSFSVSLLLKSYRAVVCQNSSVHVWRISYIWGWGSHYLNTTPRARIVWAELWRCVRGVIEYGHYPTKVWSSPRVCSIQSAMILSAPHILRALRWVPPAIVILGSPPTYLTVWTAIRAVTLPFSDSIYRRLEEQLYSSYQACVGFFYETWSGVEVRQSL